MKDLSRTLVHAAIAALLVGLVLATRPAMPESQVFADQGKPFYPEFTDPLKAASLEVVDRDEASDQVRRFKVVFEGGRYVIPSKWNHPADAKDRLARAAASMIGLKKLAIGTDQPKDHAMYGVVDPSEGGEGRGTRVTLLDGTGKPLSDLIFGKKVKDKAKARYARLPGQKRVYETTLEEEISAKFSDWVETDLLQVSGAQLKKLVLDSYSIDEEANRIKDQETHALEKGAEGKWTMEGLAEGEELNATAVDEVKDALDELRIVDVRPKPEPLSQFFRKEKTGVSVREQEDLRRRGFAISQGRMYANDGEIVAYAEDGVIYQLWFGEIVSDADEGKVAAKDSRYLLIRTHFEESLLPAVPEPKEVKEDGTPKSDDEKKRDREDFEQRNKERQDRVEAARKREQDLARRFADWYYVISAESFKKLSKKRVDLVKKAEAPKNDLPKTEDQKPK
jgi:hypothetical protein